MIIYLKNWKVIESIDFPKNQTFSYGVPFQVTDFKTTSENDDWYLAIKYDDKRFQEIETPKKEFKTVYKLICDTHSSFVKELKEYTDLGYLPMSNINSFTNIHSYDGNSYIYHSILLMKHIRVDEPSDELKMSSILLNNGVSLRVVAEVLNVDVSNFVEKVKEWEQKYPNLFKQP